MIGMQQVKDEIMASYSHEMRIRDLEKEEVPTSVSLMIADMPTIGEVFTQQLDLTPYEILKMVGPMAEQEMRTVQAVLAGLRKRIANVELTGAARPSCAASSDQRKRG